MMTASLFAVSPLFGEAMLPSAVFTSTNLTVDISRPYVATEDVDKASIFSFSIDQSLPQSQLQFSYTVSSNTGLYDALSVEVSSYPGGDYFQRVISNVGFTLYRMDPIRAAVADFPSNVWEIKSGSLLLNFTSTGFDSIQNSDEASSLEHGLPVDSLNPPERELSGYAVIVQSVTYYSQDRDSSGAPFSPLPVLVPGNYQMVINRDSVFNNNYVTAGDAISLSAVLTPVPEVASWGLLTWAAGTASLIRRRPGPVAVL